MATVNLPNTFGYCHLLLLLVAWLFGCLAVGFRADYFLF